MEISGVSDRLAREIELELRQIRQLLDVSAHLLDGGTLPGNYDQAAGLAATLHSFYNGIEHLFKRIAAFFGEPQPSGPGWHRELLDSMARPTDRRGAVLSDELHLLLDDYLRFRHFFRHAYAFTLQVPEMAPLAAQCPRCLQKLEAELQEFLDALDRP